MDIPKPPPGYWARVYAGWKPTIPPLPKATDKTVLTVHYTPTETVLPSDEEGIDSPLIHAAFLGSLVEPHPLVADVKERADGSMGLDHLVLPKGEGYINVDVSLGQVERALGIADALFKSFEANGFTVDVYNSKYWGERTRIVKEGCCVYISISERFQKVKYEQRVGEKRKPPYLVTEPISYAATGRLSVKVTHGYSDNKTWNDRQNEPLQQRLHEIVIYAARLIERDVRKHEAEIEKERFRVELETRKKKERSCQEELIRDANNWELANKLRRYLKALESKLRTDNPEQSAILDEYMCWAQSLINQLDPLSRMKTIWEKQHDEEEV